jgi:hypothetical protein
MSAGLEEEDDGRWCSYNAPSNNGDGAYGVWKESGHAFRRGHNQSCNRATLLQNPREKKLGET